jgi:hypothetical protein
VPADAPTTKARAKSSSATRGRSTSRTNAASPDVARCAARRPPWSTPPSRNRRDTAMPPAQPGTAASAAASVGRQRAARCRSRAGSRVRDRTAHRYRIRIADTGAVTSTTAPVEAAPRSVPTCARSPASVKAFLLGTHRTGRGQPPGGRGCGAAGRFTQDVLPPSDPATGVWPSRGGPLGAFGPVRPDLVDAAPRGRCAPAWTAVARAPGDPAPATPTREYRLRRTAGPAGGAGRGASVRSDRSGGPKGRIVTSPAARIIRLTTAPSRGHGCSPAGPPSRVGRARAPGPRRGKAAATTGGAPRRQRRRGEPP